jgi:glycosyltransferase involved in cell wall biosynthesis
VSVLVAVHDGARHLEPAITSVLRQTVHDLELVVVDDASSDETPASLRGVRDPRLIVVRNDERLGLAGALNVGLDRCRGRYVARMDGDDIAFPEWLERQLRELHDQPQLAMVGAGVVDVDDDARVGSVHLLPSGAGLRWHALFSSPFLHNTVVVARERLESHGLRYDATFGESEDYDLWTRLLAVADGDNVPEALVLYRQHRGQATVRRRGLQRELQRRVALREIAGVAPDLDEGEKELAWLVGSGQPVPSNRARRAVEAFLAVLECFEHRWGEDRAVRWRAARSLARAATVEDVRTLLAASLRVAPEWPARYAAARARRRPEERRARTRARRMLAQLETEAGTRPLRVAAVFPEPTPYRAPLLDRVAERAEVELTVVYAAVTVAGRTWQVEPQHRAVFLRGLRIPGAERILRHDYPLTPGIARALADAAPDVVVASGWSTFAAQAAIAWSRLHDVPYVVVVESHDADARPAWRRLVKDAVVPPVVKGASATLATGTLARASLVARGAAPERIHVFANTIDVAAFAARTDALSPLRDELREELGAAKEDVLGLCVGRLAPEKGMDDLVRAVAAAADPRLVLVLAGEGGERAQVEALARELDVRLVLAGDRPWERISELYVAADVFALLSTWEPWGVVVNEAAASGLPLVLSRAVGAAHDLLEDGGNGYFVEPRDVDGAADALRRLAADPQLRAAFGARSREIAHGWGYEPSVEGFLTAVREAASSR